MEDTTMGDMTLDLGPQICTVRAFGPDEAARLCRRAAEAPGWAPAPINADLAVDRRIRDAEVLQADADPPLFASCHHRLVAATSAAAARLAPTGRLAEMQFVRYTAGGTYVDHRDSPAPGATPRVVSLVCYLNDDFSGGATVFSAGGVRVEPVSGMVVAFAPLLLHRAEPVTAGTKYVITAWYHEAPGPGGGAPAASS